MTNFRSHARTVLTLVVSTSLLIYILNRIDTDEVLTEISGLPAHTPILLLALVAGNLLLVTVRLYVQVHAAGFRIPFSAAIRANAAGLLSGLVVINLLGALAGRFYTLKRYGIGPGTIAAITGIERILLVIVGGTLFIVGSASLFGYEALALLARKSSLSGMAGVILLVLAIVILFVKDKNEQYVLHRLLKWTVVRKTLCLFALTLSTQIVMLFVYYVAAKGIGTDASILSLLAAACIISFAASIPVSVNGWGVREFASIYAFGQLGIDPATAVSISILVGLASTAVVLLCGPVLLTEPRDKAIETEGLTENTVAGSIPATSTGSIDDRAKLWLSLIPATLIAVLIYFQVHIEIGNTLLNINLGDPIAFLGVLTCILLLARSFGLIGSIPGATFLWLAAVSTVLLLGFLNGVARFGMTDWALTNRLTGWLILLGYFCIGVVYIRQTGLHGLRRLSQIMMLTAALIVVYYIFYREFLAFTGAISGHASNFEGFAFNRNAFCFQLLITASGGLAFSKSIARHRNAIAWAALLGVIFLGIWFTQSRTGLSIIIAMLAGLMVLRMVDRLFVVKTILLSAGFGVAATFLPPFLFGIVEGEFVVATSKASSAISMLHVHSESVSERWQSLAIGFDLWLSNPVFGAGLGAFVAKQIASAGGGILVIHSIPVWILAEFGLSGAAAILGIPFYLVYRYRFADPASLPPHAVFLICTVFIISVYGLAHDMAFQRTFWFTLGMIAAASSLRRRPFTTRK